MSRITQLLIIIASQIVVDIRKELSIILLSHLIVKNILKLKYKEKHTYYYAIIYQVPLNFILMYQVLNEYPNPFDILGRQGSIFSGGNATNEYYSHIQMLNMVMQMAMTVEDTYVQENDPDSKTLQLIHHIFCSFCGLYFLCVERFGFTILLVSSIAEFGNFSLNLQDLVEGSSVTEISMQNQLVSMTLSNIVSVLVQTSGLQMTIGYNNYLDIINVLFFQPSLKICQGRLDQMIVKYRTQKEGNWKTKSY